jgi:hypothetical protein
MVCAHVLRCAAAEGPAGPGYAPGAPAAPFAPANGGGPPASPLPPHVAAALASGGGGALGGRTAALVVCPTRAEAEDAGDMCRAMAWHLQVRGGPAGLLIALF